MMIEIILFYGVALGFVFWQIVQTNRDIARTKRDAEENEDPAA